MSFNSLGVNNFFKSPFNTISGLPSANFGVLVTDLDGIPSIFSILPQQVQENITTLGNVGSNVMALTVSGVDGTALATTKIATTDSGMRFVPMFINVEVETVSGFVSVPSLSVGTNGSVDDILSITPLTGASSANIIFQVPVNALLTSVAPSTDISVKITTGAVATTYTLRVSVTGFYE